MHRFFVPRENIKSDTVYFPQNVMHQIKNVLRMKPGDDVIALDNAGWEYYTSLIALHEGDYIGSIYAKKEAIAEPERRVTLYQSMLKKDNIEWTMQKCTEIGVGAFVPMITSRTIAKIESPLNNRKRQRWERILTEAAEQCGRGRIPELFDPISFEDALKHTPTASFIPCFDDTAKGLSEVFRAHSSTRSVALFIGPEGGFTPEEVALAKKRRVIPVTLGKRTLRAETAAIVGSALLLDETESE